MAIIQANVPQAHLATAMGNPNQLLVEYSTDLLLPVPGPYLIAQLRRDFVHGLMVFNDFLAFVEDARTYFAAGETLNLVASPGPYMVARPAGRSRYGQVMTPAARSALRAEFRAMTAGRTTAVRPDEDLVPIRESLLARLSAPNLVFREMLDDGLLARSPTLFSANFVQAASFDDRSAMVLGTLLGRRQNLVPQIVTPTMAELADQAMATARAKHPRYLQAELDTLSANTRNLLIQWLVAYHLEMRPSIPDTFAVDLGPILGFSPWFFVKEWALNRKERLRLLFGTPDLRGPLAAEPIAPQGTYRREDYSASQEQMALLTAEARRTRTAETLSLSSVALRRELDSVYYSGPGSLNELTNQASNSLLTEERRRVIFSIIREVSESRESETLDVTSRITSSTITREAPGVDATLAATHHRFKVVIPLTATIEMYDVGLTWSPRVANPFFALRQAVYDAYETAYNSHLRQYYVPEPVNPPVIWERYVVSTDVNIEVENELVVSRRFSIQLSSTDREDHPDFGGWTVVWNQSESFWNDDPDHFVARLENPSFNSGTISGRIRLETDDGGADFQGFAHVEVPVLRYSQDTINALAQYELEMRDYNLKRQALEAQAHQYARIKEREFIERHERREPLLKIVFHELIRRLCVPNLAQHISYYKEIISRCIDWTNAKMDLEPAPLNALAYPDFEADHFINSLWVRLFLPISHNAEQTLFDALTACGTFQVRASVENARNQVEGVRNRLQQGGPDQIDQFSTEMVIGEHIEAVMSAYEMGT